MSKQYVHADWDGAKERAMCSVTGVVADGRGMYRGSLRESVMCHRKEAGSAAPIVGQWYGGGGGTMALVLGMKGDEVEYDYRRNDHDVDKCILHRGVASFFRDYPKPVDAPAWAVAKALDLPDVKELAERLNAPREYAESQLCEAYRVGKLTHGVAVERVVRDTGGDTGRVRLCDACHMAIERMLTNEMPPVNTWADMLSGQGTTKPLPVVKPWAELRSLTGGWNRRTPR